MLPMPAAAAAAAAADDDDGAPPARVFLAASNWKSYRQETESEAAMRRAKTGAAGFVTGVTVGSLGFFLRTMKVSKGMGGAGLFMGFVLGGGSVMRSW